MDAKKPVAKLPPEVWSLIFYQLGSQTDLCQCLLVNRQWYRLGIHCLWHEPYLDSTESLCAFLIQAKSFLYAAARANQPPFQLDQLVSGVQMKLNVHESSSIDDCHERRSSVSSFFERVQRSWKRPQSRRQSTGQLMPSKLPDQRASSRYLPSPSPSETNEQSNQYFPTRSSHSTLEEFNEAFDIYFGSLVRHLYLENTGLHSSLTEQRMALLLKYCVNITRLDLTGCMKLTGNPFQMSLDNTESPVESLDSWLPDTYFHLGDEPWSDMDSHRQYSNSQMTETDRVKTSSYSVGRPLGKCRAVSLAGCTGLSLYAFRSLVQFTNTNLRILNLNRCTQIDDLVLQDLGLYCPNLTGLSLNGCTKIGDQGLIALLHPGGDMFGSEPSRLCSRLEELSLTDLFRLTDQSIEYISHCTHLTYLRLTGCSQVTEKSLIPIVNYCRLLEYLFLARCQLHDKFLYALGRHPLCIQGRGRLIDNPSQMSLRPLKYLDIAYATNITLPALSITLSACPDLVSLGMGACRSFLKEHSWVMDLSENVPVHVPRESIRWYCVIRGHENLTRFRNLIRTKIGY